MILKMNISRLSRRLKKRDIILVDVMEEEIHRNVHIEGAINIPFSKLEHDASKKLDPVKEIVTYSIDYDCPVSRLAAKKLRSLGFRKAYYYPGGLKEWIETNGPVTRKSTKKSQ